MTRTYGLKGAAALALLLSLAGAAEGAGSDCRKWKVGMSTHLGKELTADQFIKLKQAGIDAVEFGLNSVDTPEAAKAMRQLAGTARKWAEPAGIEIWSVHIPFGRNLDISNSSEEQRLEVVRKLSALMEVYAPLKAKKLVLHPSAEISKPIPDSERQVRIAACRKSLVELSRKAARIKAQIALECLPRSCLGNTSREIQMLVEGIDQVGICLDTNHLLQEKNEEFVRRLGSRIVTLHVSDYDAVDERHWLPGKGVNDWKTIVEALQTAGYRGPFLFECRGTPEEKIAIWRQIQKSVDAPGRPGS